MINTGKAPPVNKDFAGAPVPYNGSYDIGAYEYNGEGLPVANAGMDQEITLPVNSLSITGSGTDGDGTITGYQWTQVSGPGKASFGNSSAASTEVSNLVQGTYIFRLKVTDNDGATGYDEVQVLVHTPLPSSGTRFVKVNLFGGTNPYNNTEWNNWNVSAALTSATLNYSNGNASAVSATLTKHTLSDNGSTYGGGMAPAEVLRYTSNASVARTLTINGLSTGASYNLELYGSRNNTGNSTVFTVNGTAITIVTDKNLTQKAAFNNLKPTISGQLTVNIQNLNGYNYLNGFILTEVGPGTPVADAGADHVITLPLNLISLTGGGSDNDGSIAGYHWTKLSDLPFTTFKLPPLLPQKLLILQKAFMYFG